MNKIIYIANKPKEYVMDMLRKIFDVDVVLETLAFDALNSHYSAMVLAEDLKAEPANEIVQLIRRTAKSFMMPIFSEKNGQFFPYAVEEAVFDLKEYIKRVETLSLEIAEHNYQTWENRILAYFYTRASVNIVPKIAEKNPMFYSYPLVEHFYEGQEDYFYWLEEMARQNVLTRVKVIDRLFCCPYCFSARLKFSDHCPSCNSINIRNEKFVHCFTCGHVAPESNFLQNGSLICPACKTRLKLLGEDYDRPLENGVCMDCGAYHVDSKLNVYCLDCTKDFETEKLSKKVVYEYKLTDFGRNQVKFGTSSSVGLIVNELNYIEIKSFSFMLDWLIAMQQRYKEDAFGLLLLKIVLNESASSYDLLLNFAKFLRGAFRTTDLCSKMGDNVFVFAFPKTNKEGIEFIKQRIETFLQTIEYRQGKFTLNSVYFSSVDYDFTNNNAQQILMDLASRL